MKDKFMKNGVFSLEYDNETLRDLVLELQEENQELKLELSGYRQAILEDKDMLGLKEESKELKNTIKRLEEEVNKQAKVIQWYEKETRHNQEIIIDLSKRIDKTTQAIDELLSYDDFKDITNAIFGNVKEELKFYLSNYKTLEEFRKANLKEN